MSAGNRVTELGITFTAGELINQTYSFEGLEYYWNPIEITASNKYIDFDDGGGEENVSVTEDFYKDPHELAAAIETAMEGATADDITVTYGNTTGKYTIASDGGTLSLLWKTGTHGADNSDDHIGSTIGFSDAADDTLAVTYTSDTAIDLSSPQTPSYDSDSDPLVAKNNVCLIGDADDNTCFAASNVEFTMSNTRTTIDSICAESGRSGSLITAREVTVSVTALLEQYEADKFRKFRENEDTRFAYIFGTKSAGNWVAGKCGCLYIPTGTITSFSITDSDGLVTLEMELRAYVDSDGNGEVYLSFV
jgi:hypothetical protein